MRAISSSSSRRPRWAAIAKRPYSTKLPGSTRSATFSRAVRPPAAWRRSTASGAGGVLGQGAAREQLGQVVAPLAVAAHRCSLAAEPPKIANGLAGRSAQAT